MINAFRTNLAAAAAQAIKDHTGHVVEARNIAAYVTLKSYPATLSKAVDFLSMSVGDLDERDFRDMEILAAKHFMTQGQ